MFEAHKQHSWNAERSGLERGKYCQRGIVKGGDNHGEAEERDRRMEGVADRGFTGNP